MKIVCVGGGPAGLYASILIKLRDPGHDITLFERSNAGSTAGAGVTIGRDLLARLYEQDKESADLIYRTAFIYHEQAMYSRGEKVVVQAGEDYNITRQGLTGHPGRQGGGPGRAHRVRQRNREPVPTTGSGPHYRCRRRQQPSAQGGWRLPDHC